MRVELHLIERPLPIPYPSIERVESTNYGYMDLKADPQLIDEIPELRDAPELRSLVAALNAPGSPFRSLGCEKVLSNHEDPENPHLHARFVSYVDIAFADMVKNSDRDLFVEMVEVFNSHCYEQRDALPHFLIASFDLRPSIYHQDGVEGWSVAAWVGGFGTDAEEARTTWAVGIKVLERFLTELWDIPSREASVEHQPPH
jgi:hypothetical protein